MSRRKIDPTPDPEVQDFIGSVVESDTFRTNLLSGTATSAELGLLVEMKRPAPKMRRPSP